MYLFIVFRRLFIYRFFRFIDNFTTILIYRLIIVKKRKRVNVANLNCYLILKRVYVQNKSQKEKKNFCKRNSSLKYFSIFFE